MSERILTIFLKFNHQTLFEGVLGRPILPFAGQYYIQKKCLDPAIKLEKQSLGFSFRHGLYRNLSLILPSEGKVNNLCKQVLIPNPFFLFTWLRLVIAQKHKVTACDVVDLRIPLEQRVPSLQERQIGDLDDAPTSPAQLRIQFLREHLLTQIDSRDSSILYKDSEAERLWQYIERPEKAAVLAEVSHTQWSYEYLEKRLGLHQSVFSDQDFYENLETDPQNKSCEVDACESYTVLHSSLCRDHHFESVMGRVYRVGES